MIDLIPEGYNYRAAAKEQLAKIQGQVVVGYRYGKAPASGNSFNYLDQRWEDGVSMASVMSSPEVNSFAVMGAKIGRKYYYQGVVQNTGSDGEITLKNVKPITAKEYRESRNHNSELNNDINIFLFYNSMVGRAHNIINDYEHCWGDFSKRDFYNDMADVLDEKIKEAARKMSEAYLKNLK